MPESFIIAAVVFLSVYFFILFISGCHRYKQVDIAEHLGRVLGEKPEIKDSKTKLDKNIIRDNLTKMLDRLPGTKSYKKKIEEELTRADVLLKGEEFLVLVLLVVLGLGAVSILLTGSILTAAAASCFGIYMPFFFIKVKKNKRKSSFNSQIGEALVIIANSLRSGFSFLQAMDMVSKEMPDPIASEFRTTITEMNWGSSTEAALLGLAERVKSDDMDLVITAVLIQRQVGGNLAEILENIAHTIRERVRIKGEIKTLTAQGRISGLIVGLLPLVLTAIIYLLNPSYLSLLFNSKVGLVLLTGALMSQMLGVLIIRRIINIEV